MIFLRVNMAFDALNVDRLPHRIVRNAAQVADVGEAVRLHIRFSHYKQAVQVAKLVKARVVRVVGGTYRVDIVLLHQDQVALHAIHPHRAAPQMIVVMTIDAVQLQITVVNVEQAVFHLDIPKPDALRDDFQRLAMVIF